MVLVKRIFTLSLSLLSLGGGAAAADNAVLKNGFAIKHEHRQVQGEKTRLFLAAGQDSFVDVATADVEKYERIEEVAVAAAPKPIVSAKTLDIKALVKDASAKTLIDEDFIHSVIQAESAAPAAVHLS